MRRRKDEGRGRKGCDSFYGRNEWYSKGKIQENCKVKMRINIALTHRGKII